MMMLDDDENGKDDVEDDDDYAPAHDDAGQLAGCVHPDPPPPRIQPLLLCEKNITNCYCVTSKISRHCHCIAFYPLLPFEGNFAKDCLLTLVKSRLALGSPGCLVGCL